MSAEESTDEVVGKYKKLLSLARSSLETNQASLAAKDKQISQLIATLEEERANRRKSQPVGPGNTVREDENASLPRSLLRRVDVDGTVWVLIEFEGGANNSWKEFSSEEDLDDFIQRLPGIPLKKPFKSLTTEESQLLEEESRRRVDRISEEFRRYKVRMEIMRKQKDAENKQISSASVAPAEGASLESSQYDELQKFKEQESKWKLAFERVVRENEQLRTRGGDAALISQLREQYESCLKEKNDVEDKLKIYEKLLHNTSSQGQKSLEQSYLELREEYKEFRRRVQAIDAQRQLEEELRLLQNNQSSTPTPQQEVVPSNTTDTTEHEIRERHIVSNSRSDRNISSDDSSILGHWPGHAKGMMESKVQYIRQMVFQYLSCKEADVKLHIESALMAIFRFNEQERASVEDRKRDDSQDTLTSISNFLGTFSTHENNERNGNALKQSRSIFAVEKSPFNNNHMKATTHSNGKTSRSSSFSQSSSSRIRKQHAIFSNEKIVEHILLYVGFQSYYHTSLVSLFFYNIYQNHEFMLKLFDVAVGCLGLKSSSPSITINRVHRPWKYILPQEDSDMSDSSVSMVSTVKILLRRLATWPTSCDLSVFEIEKEDTKNYFLSKSSNWSHLVPIEKYNFVGNNHFPCLPMMNSTNLPTSVSTALAPFTVIQRVYTDHYSGNHIGNIQNNGNGLYNGTAVAKVALSCIAYFEISSRDTSKRNASPNLIDFAIGLVSSLSSFQLRGGFNSVAYHRDGRCFQSGQAVNGIEGPKCDLGDTIGCGIVYPPLGHQYGQIFFTKNEEVSLTLDLGFQDFSSSPWFPIFYTSSVDANFDFNFGYEKPFLFNVSEYENSLQRVKGFDGQESYRGVVVDQEHVIKPNLHPALKDSDHHAIKEHMSTAATTSDGSDQDGERCRLKRRKHYDSVSSLDSLWNPNQVAIPRFAWNNIDEAMQESAAYPPVPPFSMNPPIIGNPKSASLFTDSVRVMELCTLHDPVKMLTFDNSYVSQQQRATQSWADVNSRYAEDGDAMDDDMSVATSLLVEVASIDEDGSYVGYGGASDDDDEPENDSIHFGGASSPDLSSHAAYHSPPQNPSCTSTTTSVLLSNEEGLQTLHSSASSVSSYSIRDEYQNFPGSVDEMSLYGYDGGSERCKRDDESDIGDDAVVGTSNIDGMMATGSSQADRYDERSVPPLQSRRRNFPVQFLDINTNLIGMNVNESFGVRSPSESCYPRSASPANSNSMISNGSQQGQLRLHRPKLRTYHQHGYAQLRRKEKRKTFNS